MLMPRLLHFTFCFTRFLPCQTTSSQRRSLQRRIALTPMLQTGGRASNESLDLRPLSDTDGSRTVLQRCKMSSALTSSSIPLRSSGC